MGEQKSYDMPLVKRFEVIFKKKFGAFKAGDKTKVTLPIAMKWISGGYIDPTTEIDAAIESAKAKDVVKVKEKRSKEDDKTE